MWEKEKMLVTSIFFFSRIVFYSVRINTAIWATLIFSSANYFNLDRSKILSFGKRLRPQSKDIKTFNNLYKEGFWKHCGERRNVRMQHFLLLLQILVLGTKREKILVINIFFDGQNDLFFLSETNFNLLATFYLSFETVFCLDLS